MVMKAVIMFIQVRNWLRKQLVPHRLNLALYLVRQLYAAERLLPTLLLLFPEQLLIHGIFLQAGQEHQLQIRSALRQEVLREIFLLLLTMHVVQVMLQLLQ